jgi:type I restriction enzyme S subunit
MMNIAKIDTPFLGPLVRIRTGKLDANASSPNGKYPFFTCAIKTLKIDHYAYNCECVLVAGNGDLNAKYYNGKFNAYQRTYIIESNDKKVLNIRYLYYFLDKYIEKLRTGSIGGVIKYIKLSHLTDIRIPLPPLTDQIRIATILDKADAIRRKRRQAIQLTDEFLRSVFLDIFEDSITNPKNWEKGHIQDLCEEIVDCPHATPKYAAGQTNFACVRSSDIQNGYMDWSTTKYVEEAEYKGRIKRLEPAANDVIYCREGARFGNAARIPEEKNICLGQRMMLFRSNHIIATAEFIWALLNSDNIYHQAVQKIGGSASPHINVADIKKFSIFIPPLSIQQNYSIVVKKLDAMKEKFQSLTLISDQIFKSITQRAFRGEL